MEILNSNPTGTVSIVGEAVQCQPLYATNNIADADGIGIISYQWFINGQKIDGATKDTYSPTIDDIGGLITVSASYVDGVGKLESVSSDQTETVKSLVYQTESNLNFNCNRTSNFVSTQLPAFVRDGGPDFVSFLEAYYRFLETKMVKITVGTSDETGMNSITEGDIVASSHFLMCENGSDPVIDVTGIEYTPYMDYNTSFSNNDIEIPVSVYDTTNKKTIIFYRDSLTHKSVGIIVSGDTHDTLQFSTPFVFCDNYVQSIKAVYDPISGDIIIVYTDVVNGLMGYIKTCKIQNNTLVYGSPIVFESCSCNNISITRNIVGEKFIITHSTIEQSPKNIISVCSIESDGIFIGNDILYKEGEIQYVSSVYDSVNDRIVISYYDTVIENGSSIVCKISGYGVSTGLPCVFNSGVTSYINSVYSLVDGKVVTIYQDTHSNGYGKYSIGSVSTQLVPGIVPNTLVEVDDKFMDIKFESENIFNTRTTSDISSTYDYDVKKIFVTFHSSDDSGENNCAVVLNLNGSIPNEVVYSSFNTTDTTSLYAENLKRVIVIYNDDSNKLGKLSVFSSFQFTYNIHNYGYGFHPNLDITIELSGGDGTGATAVGNINSTGSLDYIIIYHGSGYTTPPTIGNIGGEEIHEVYLGEGTDDNPIIELEGYNSIVGKIIGHEDIDTISSSGTMVRNIYIDHWSGDISRAKIDDVFGELFNPTLLRNTADNSSLPIIYDVKEIENPVNAMNNMHSYNDIDFTFSAKLFLGNDLYSLMYNEIMPNWPTLVSSIENKMKAIIGRNIKDIYKSIGTEDAIKFVFRVVYGRDVTVLSPSEKMFCLNSGVWDTIHTISVEVDPEGLVLGCAGRLLYNMSNIEIDSAIHSTETDDLEIKTVNNHNLIDGSYITLLGDQLYNGEYKITVEDVKTIHVNISYGDVDYTQPTRDLRIASQYGLVELVTESVDKLTATIQLSNISGSFTKGEYVRGVLNDGKQFTCLVSEELNSTEGYISDKCLLNGSVQKPLPLSYEKYRNYPNWDDVYTIPAAIKVSDHINTDRIQDGDYYQQFSYVVKIKKENPPLLELYKKDDITNSIIKLVHPVGFKLIIEEE
jgi:hypothetical protein